MQIVDEVDSATIERVKKQHEFLLRIFQAECAKNPSSRAAESSRSNVIALRDTIKHLYGLSVAPDMANLNCGAR